MQLDQMINLDRYPIHRPNTPAFDTVVKRVRNALAFDGCAVLDGFVRPQALAAMVKESHELKPETVAIDRPWVPYPPYHIPQGETWPPNHPRVHHTSRRNRFVCYDMLARDSVTRCLYEATATVELIRQCVGADVLYPYGDPLGACTLSIQESGEELPWHFDLSHFVVSLLIQSPSAGGDFQYVPQIRSESEQNYAKVRRLLDGSNDDVVTLDLKPGDLQLFEGRYSMHRVTAPMGATWRGIALLSYCQEPGVIGDAKMQQHLFGRTCQEPL